MTAAMSRADLMHHVIERAGGHYNEIGDAISYIVSGQVAVKSFAQPVAYTPTGLRFDDGSTAGCRRNHLVHRVRRYERQRGGCGGAGSG